MDEKLRQEVFNFHYQNDALFRRLAIETKKEKDDTKFMIGRTLLDLVLDGKIAVSQDIFGELCFAHITPN